MASRFFHTASCNERGKGDIECVNEWVINEWCYWLNVKDRRLFDPDIPVRSYNIFYLNIYKDATKSKYFGSERWPAHTDSGSARTRGRRWWNQQYGPLFQVIIPISSDFVTSFYSNLPWRWRSVVSFLTQHPRNYPLLTVCQITFCILKSGRAHDLLV